MRRARIFRDRSGEWRYSISAMNGQIVGQSEGYTRRWSAIRAARRDISVNEIQVCNRYGDHVRMIHIR